MTPWDWAAIGLLPPLLLATIMAGRGPQAGRLVAVQLATSIGVLAGVALTFVSDQPSSTDLPLAIALLALPGTLVYALFEERWL